MATVQLKYGERVLKLRPQSMSIANLAMIFKLDANEGVYLTSEEGEIILPGENSSFSIDNFDVCYTVNGEQVAKGGPKAAATSDLSHHPVGLLLSYQPSPSAARAALNPPPGRSNTSTLTATRLMRPSFRMNATKNSGWKKSLTIIDIGSSGSVLERYQLHFTLQEQMANVENIKELLKGQLGYEVQLLDSKHLHVVAGETTSGK